MSIVRPEPNLVRALAALYPGTAEGRDYVVRDDGDGKGARIRLWDPALGEPPTAEAIAERWYALLDAEERNAYRVARAAALAEAVPLDEVIAALVEATPADAGTPLGRVKTLWERIKADHPPPADL